MLRMLALGALSAVCLAACGSPPAKDVTVSGQLIAVGPPTEPMTASAVAHVVVNDRSDPELPPVELASADVPAPALPVNYSLTVPAAKLPKSPALFVTARVKDGDDVLYAAADKTPVVAGQPTDVRLVPVTPAPLPYICGNRKFRIAFTNQAAQVTEGPGLTLVPAAAPAPGSPPGQKTYQNAKMTFVKNGVNVAFAPGKGAPQPCTIGE